MARYNLFVDSQGRYIRRVPVSNDEEAIPKNIGIQDKDDHRCLQRIAEDEYKTFTHDRGCGTFVNGCCLSLSRVVGI